MRNQTLRPFIVSHLPPPFSPIFRMGLGTRLHFLMLVGEPKFHSRGRCTIALTNKHSDLRSNSSSGLCINLCYLYCMSTTTAPQDAHKRFVMQVAEWLTASLYQANSIYTMTPSLVWNKTPSVDTARWALPKIFRVIYYPCSNIHTHVHNAAALVWGSLRLAPITRNEFILTYYSEDRAFQWHCKFWPPLRCHHCPGLPASFALTLHTRQHKKCSNHIFTSPQRKLLQPYDRDSPLPWRSSQTCSVAFGRAIYTRLIRAYAPLPLN